SHGPGTMLYGLEGLPPPLIDLPPGCALRPRCHLATEICARIDPPLTPLPGGDHWAACHNNHGGPVRAARPDSAAPPPPESPAASRDSRPIMEIRAVSKRFSTRNMFGRAGQSGHLAVKNVSLA